MTGTEDVVEFILDSSSVPESVANRSAAAIRDFLGVALYATQNDICEILQGYAAVSPANGASTVLDGTTTGPERACLLNGAYGYAVDFDDTFASLPLHPTAVVMPATLTVGELVDADGADFLRAYAVGPLGAAAAAGVLFDLDREKLHYAFGIAASSTGGLRKNFGTPTKPLHAGFAASSGLRAAILAREGATADANILDGLSGYGAMMAGEDYNPNELRGDGYSGVGDVALKLYPSAHITHGAMDALRQVRERRRLTPRDVKSVTATIHPGGEDVLIHNDPMTALEEKFSLEFCLAAVLRAGDPGLSEFTDDYVRADETQSLMERVKTVYDADAVSGLGRYGGQVTVETVDGAVYENSAGAPGSPENPVAEGRLHGKLNDCVGPTDIDADALVDAVDGLTDGGNVVHLIEALGGR